MLAPSRRGAHPAEWLQEPSLELIEGWSAASGVAMVTLAPELPDALDVTAALRSRGVIVSIGHTDCSATEFRAARDAGASYVTHLYNAMRPFAHRDPGPIGAALADSWAVVGLICDGVHVDPVAVAMAWQARGPDRLTLVTDAVAAQGAGIGPSRLGGVDVIVGDGTVRTATGSLAGSTLTLDQAVRNLIAFTGCGVSSAIRTVTATPARVLGVTDRGSIDVGCRADLVVLDADVSVRTTIVGGAIAWRS
jgi:N-acetylglucosamine-6-phosphate deacetylase